MATVASLVGILEHLRGSLTSHPDFFRHGGLAADDPGLATEARELEDIRGRLEIVLRELKNRSNMLEFQRQNARSLPTEQRNRALSSVKTQSAELAEVSKLADEVKALLKRMLGDTMMINPLDGFGGLISQAMESQENIHHLQQILQQETGHPGPVITNTHTETMGIDGIILPVVVMLAAAIARLQKKRKT